MKLEYTIEELQQLETVAFAADPEYQEYYTFYKLTGVIPDYEAICDTVEYGEIEPLSKPDDLDVTFLMDGTEVSLFDLVTDGEWVVTGGLSILTIDGVSPKFFAYGGETFLIIYIKNIGLAILKPIVDYEISQVTDTVYVYAADSSAETFDPVTREELWLQAIADAISGKGGGGGGGGTDPKEYTISGVGTTPVALPNGLTIPEAYTSQFTGTASWNGLYEDENENTHSFSETGTLKEFGSASGTIYLDFYENSYADLYFEQQSPGYITLMGVGCSALDVDQIIMSSVEWEIVFTDARK